MTSSRRWPRCARSRATCTAHHPQVPEYIREQNARGLEQFQQRQAEQGRRKDFKAKHTGSSRK